MTQGETYGAIWCQALKEVQGGREIRVRRSSGVTRGRSWNLGPGGSEKLLKFLRRIWVFIFLVTFSAVGRIGWKECRETFGGREQAEMETSTNQGKKGWEIQLRGDI